MPTQVIAYYKLDYAPDGKFDGTLDIIAQDKNGDLYKVNTTQTDPNKLTGLESVTPITKTNDPSYADYAVYTTNLDVDGDKVADHIRSPKGNSTLHTTPSNANLAMRILNVEPGQDSDFNPNCFTDKLDIKGDGIKDHAEATNPHYSGPWVELGVRAKPDINWRYAQIKSAWIKA